MEVMVMRRLIILHVEDNREDARLLARACEAANLQTDVYEVPGGGEAVEYLKGEKLYKDRKKFPFPDLIILDLKMPGMTGFDFLEWLRRDPRFVSLPVLVFTKSRDAQDKARALAQGANGFFVKPGDFASLVQLAESFKQFCKILPGGNGQK
jgi:CheY-like chemotaxis protein